MKKELRQKWIEALRSGEYNQGKGLLYNRANDAYCCLGVLCRVAGMQAEELVGSGTLSAVNKSNLLLLNGHEPIEGLAPGYVPGYFFEQMNDHDCKSFAEIADYIEQRVGIDGEPFVPVQT